MDHSTKEVVKSQLKKEKEAIDELKKTYEEAIKRIDEKIKLLQADIQEDELLQSKVYQIKYQESLKKQLEPIIEKIHNKNYKTIDEYINDCYVNGWIGTFYDLASQDIPIIAPMDQTAITKAVVLDSKLSEPLYKKLGINTQELKTNIRNELSRGLSTGQRYMDIARNISNAMKVDLNKSIRIAVTEGHRVQNEAKMDSLHKAKEIGADIVKQWDATMDKKVRPSHRMVDGEIRELDEAFSNGLMYPGDKSGSAKEVIRCRCVLLQRARWELDEEELNILKERAEFYGLDKSKNFEDFKKKYLNTINEISFVIRENQEYKKVIRGTEETFNINKYTKVSVNRIKTYKDNIYVSRKANIKPKALQMINRNTDLAIKAWKIDSNKKPKIIIVSPDEIPNAYGKYDAIDNVVFYASDIVDKRIIKRTGDIEYHEMWHMKQAENFRNKYGAITSDNYTGYLNKTCENAKDIIDSLGINEYNVDEISNYALRMYRAKRYDEVEAEYRRIKRK